MPPQGGQLQPISRCGRPASADATLSPGISCSLGNVMPHADEPKSFTLSPVSGTNRVSLLDDFRSALDHHSAQFVTERQDQMFAYKRSWTCRFHITIQAQRAVSANRALNATARSLVDICLETKHIIRLFHHPELQAPRYCPRP